MIEHLHKVVRIAVAPAALADSPDDAVVAFDRRVGQAVRGPLPGPASSETHLNPDAPRYHRPSLQEYAALQIDDDELESRAR